MFRGMASDFAIIKGEGILRVRGIRTCLRQGKLKIWDEKKKRKQVKKNKRGGWKRNIRKEKRIK